MNWSFIVLRMIIFSFKKDSLTFHGLVDYWNPEENILKMTSNNILRDLLTLKLVSSPQEMNSILLYY